MEKKINVAQLLKDCPQGMELDCTMFIHPVTFDKVINYVSENYPIVIKTHNGSIMSFTKYGTYTDAIGDAKCVIFPKGKTTWEGFVPPCKFKDGDIVSTINGYFIGIFKYMDDTEGDFAYCASNKIGSLSINAFLYFDRLATEEEKQKLFDAIKSNGYKWNAETKTLEKLIEPKFKVGDKIKHKTYTSIGDVVTEIKDDYYILNAESALPFVFQDEYELVPNKFDINTLKPFDEVLTRANDDDAWVCNLYSHRMKDYYVVLNAELARQCIPFEGNQHLLGTANDCDEFYKTW